MKLTLENIGPLREAEILLDGITVLAGFNGTGKSTVSKALYGVLTGFFGFPLKILQEKTLSIQNTITAYFNESAKHGTAGSLYFSFWTKGLSGEEINQISSDLASGSLSFPNDFDTWYAMIPAKLKAVIPGESLKPLFPKLKEDITEIITRPDETYIPLLVSSQIESVFDGQILTFGSENEGTILLKDGSAEQSVHIHKQYLMTCSGAPAEQVPIYLETRHPLDDYAYQNTNRTLTERETALPHLLFTLNADKPLQKLTIEEREIQKSVQLQIEDIIHGRLSPQSGSLLFIDQNLENPVSTRNLASGNKTFSVLSRLIASGSVSTGSILIIDEPETNLHPAWQLKMAEILVMLNKRMNVRLFLNTHSVYFLRAIEVYSLEYGVEDRCHYYKTEPADDSGRLFRTACVDGKTEWIYHDLYMPLKEIRNGDT